MTGNPQDRDRHLTDEELFGLAIPPAGLPEALPGHLLACGTCGRALQEWKRAVRDLVQEDADAVARRSPEEWRAAEQATMSALRRAPRATLRRAISWAAGVAAALLIGALLIRRGDPGPATAPAAAGEAAAAEDLAPEDRADDALLRELASLSRGEDFPGVWNGLAPDPSGDSSGTLEERL